MVIRRFFGICALLMCISLTAQAQDYPTKAIQLIVPNGPGGGTDTFGRVIAQRLSERLNQKVIVDNKPGAQAAIGTAFGARAAPDGYTLTVALTSSVAITPFLIPNIEYDPINDFVAVAIGVDQPFVVVTSTSSPFDDLQGLVAFASKKNEPVSFASTSSQTELVGSLFGQIAHIKTLSVPYKNASTAVIELARGDVDVMVASLPSAMPLVNAGKLKAIAVTGAERVPALPQVKTSSESGFPKFLASSWYGFLAPKGTPDNVVKILNSQINFVLGMPEVQATLLKAGMTVTTSSPEAFAARIKADYDVWGEVFRRQKK
jgi:tripartite-type tricarboxylate transporter receptor subunit TctC